VVEIRAEKQSVTNMQSSVPRMSAERWLRIARFSVVLVVATALVLAYRSGVFAEVSDPKSFSRAVLAMGAWGYVGFVVAYTCLQPFGVPGTVFIVAAPLIWPWPVAFGLSMMGTMAASVVGFSFARFVARDWVASRIPKRFRTYDESLERHAFRTVFTLRLIFWMPQVLHGFLGVSKVPFWTHFWGSFFGYIPPLFMVSFFASEVFDATGQLKPRAWMIMGGMLIVSLTVALLAKYIERSALRRKTRPNADK
jgi:uncharacterized membrane protein YdjX (TVP38/TMEM64 family)